MSGTVDRAQSIFLNALEIQEQQQRDAYLEKTCRDDAQLRDEVIDLLDHARRLGGFMSPGESTTVGNTSAHASNTIGVGSQVGVYHLREALGEGGMGEVYIAEQTQPVRRCVALKLIRHGTARQDIVTRFEAERQTLALMDHPNIATVLDGGQTESGQPFFVMELVRGLPINEFCDQARLTTADRLKLFVDVCRAVQHAHQKGIIHRDLKPSNVMVSEVDGRPVAKVIDFGVAKAVTAHLADEESSSRLELVIGTPLYMSPEQAGSGLRDVDTRSDVYSLGVMLYELLTGTTPFGLDRLKESGFEEFRRVLREENRIRPSDRISTLTAAAQLTLSEKRGCEPGKLTRLVRGELDWIVLKAVDGDRGRRYESASSLADDIERYLSGDVVEACPPSIPYRLQKLARRHRVALAMSSLALGALILGVIGLAISNSLITEQRNAARVAEANERKQKVEAEQQKAVAEQQRQIADDNYRLALDAVDTYLTEVSENQLLNAPAMQPLRHELLQQALDFYRQFADQRGADDQSSLNDLASAYERIARITEEIGSVQEAIEALENALVLRDRLALDGAPEQISRAATLRASLAASISAEQGDLQRAARLIEDSLALHDRALSSAPGDFDLELRYANSLNSAGLASAASGDRDSALEYKQRALEAYQTLSEAKPDDDRLGALIAMAHFNVGLEQSAVGRLDDALKSFQEAAGRFRSLSTEAPVVQAHRFRLAESLAQVTSVHLSRGDEQAALASSQQATSILQNLADENPSVWNYRLELAWSINRTAAVHKQFGRLTVSAERFQDAVDLIRDVVDEFPENRSLLRAQSQYQMNLAAVMSSLNRYEEAGRLMRDSMEIRQTLVDHGQLPADRFDLAKDTHNLASLRVQLGEPDEGRKLFLRAIAVEEELIRDHPETFRYQRMLLISHWGLAGALDELRESDQAITAFEAAIAIGKRLADEDPARMEVQRYLARSRSSLAVVFARMGRVAESDKLYRECVEAWQQLAERFPADPGIRFSAAIDLYNLGNSHKDAGRTREAAMAYEDAIAALEELGRTHPEAVDPILVHHCWVNLGVLEPPGAARLASFRRAYAANSDDWIVNRNIAGTLETDSDCELLSPAEALEFATRATELAPENSICWHVLGVVHYRDENWDAAEQALRESLTRGDDCKSESLLFLAMLYWQQNEQADARDCFVQAMDSLPDDYTDDDALAQAMCEASELIELNPE